MSADPDAERPGRVAEGFGELGRLTMERREFVTTQLLDLVDAALTAKIASDTLPDRVRPALERARRLVDGLLGDAPFEVGEVASGEDEDEALDEGGDEPAGGGS